MKCLKERCIHHDVCALYTFSGYASDECGFYETRQHSEWIPCSERLPEEDGWYIGSKVTQKGNHMTNSFWYADGTFFTLGEVEAWMPLPEPYKEEGDGH